MSRISQPRTPSYSKAVVTPLPPRKLFNAPFDQQTQSPFFTRFAAEIRKEIYNYAFQTGGRELLSVEASPLSFLLTCRKVYHEASLLAFGQHTFPISPNFNLEQIDSMRNLKSHLSLQQVESITTLSYDLRSNYGCKHLPYGMAHVLANAILAFPDLKRFEVRLLRGTKTSKNIHCWYNFRTPLLPARTHYRRPLHVDTFHTGSPILYLQA
jgi:hypothetical protein